MFVDLAMNVGSDQDTPAHFVFFPLFCAATEGNLEATKALLDAKADAIRNSLFVSVGLAHPKTTPHTQKRSRV